MAVTRISGDKKLADLSVTTAKINDLAITTGKINNSAVTAAKVDATGDYTVNSTTTTASATVGTDLSVSGTSTLTGAVTAGDTMDVTGNFSVATNKMTVDAVTGDVVISGGLQVDGTTTTVNSTELVVTDSNVTVNNGGNAASMTGSGLTVDNSEGVNGSIIYDAAAATNWKVGDEGAEIEVVDLSTAQTLTNKGITIIGDTIQDSTDMETAVRSLEALVEGGAGATEEGDTTSPNYALGVWTTATAIKDASIVKVYESGIRLRSGAGNDYTIDYAAGTVTFAETPADGSNITIEYFTA